MENTLGLALAAATAGVINSVAGGGTLLTFPALDTALRGSVAAGVIANATSTTALVPGSMAGTWAYHREVRQLPRWTLILMIPSLFGGLLGSLLLVVMPPNIFRVLIPWLILAAAVLFALQPQITRWTGLAAGPETQRRPIALAVAIQFFVSIYGGYFGAGAGILMLSVMGLMGLKDIHEMNALKSLLGSLINGVSVLVFIAYDRIEWRLAGLMAVAAVIGGYGGARVARRLNRSFVRAVVVTVGLTLASYYFYNEFNSKPAGP